MYWDLFEEAGILEKHNSPYGLMIDNKQILELTRAKEKLENPNLIFN